MYLKPALNWSVVFITRLFNTSPYVIRGYVGNSGWILVRIDLIISIFSLYSLVKQRVDSLLRKKARTFKITITSGKKLSLRTHALILLPIHRNLSSLSNQRRVLHVELASFLIFWRWIFIQLELIARMNAHLHVGNTTILCLIPRYHTSKKVRRVKQFFAKKI